MPEGVPVPGSPTLGQGGQRLPSAATFQGGPIGSPVWLGAPIPAPLQQAVLLM